MLSLQFSLICFILPLFSQIRTAIIAEEEEADICARLVSNKFLQSNICENASQHQPAGQ